MNGFCWKTIGCFGFERPAPGCPLHGPALHTPAVVPEPELTVPEQRFEAWLAEEAKEIIDPEDRPAYIEGLRETIRAQFVRVSIQATYVAESFSQTLANLFPPDPKEPLE